MLVGRRVKDRIDRCAAEKSGDCRAVERAAEHRDDLRRARTGLRRMIAQFLFDRIKRIFGDVEQHQPPGRLPQDAAAKLRTDRAARSGDQHGPARDVGPQQFGIGRGFVAIDDVFDFDRSQR